MKDTLTIYDLNLNNNDDIIKIRELAILHIKDYMSKLPDNINLTLKYKGVSFNDSCFEDTDYILVGQIIALQNLFKISKLDL